MKKITKILASGFIATSIISTAIITPIEVTRNNNSNLSTTITSDKRNILNKSNLTKNTSFNINEISTK
ncbi:hypothetical protein J6W34_06975 [bacterium]|nr:hypothetical protein [bacterium]